MALVSLSGEAGKELEGDDLTLQGSETQMRQAHHSFRMCMYVYMYTW